MELRKLTSYWRVRFPLLTIAFVAVLVLASCGAADNSDATATPDSQSGTGSGEERVLTLGNIDATNPSEKIKEFQPLADYLTEHLDGVSEGRVLIAKDTTEMARLLGDGDVDLYIDPTFPALDVCKLTDCQFILRQWKGGQAEMGGVFVTTRDSEINSIEDVTGHVLMLEQPHSTVGYILPLATIRQHGISARSIGDPQESVATDEIGFYVSSGGQTSMNLLLDGTIDALGIGERAFGKFSPDVQQQVKIFEQTITAPSQLVIVNPDFDADLRGQIVQLLTGLDQNDAGKSLLKTLRDTKKFDEPPADIEQQLDDLYDMAKPGSQ